jgi:hypothetical protein
VLCMPSLACAPFHAAQTQPQQMMGPSMYRPSFLETRSVNGQATRVCYAWCLKDPLHTLSRRSHRDVQREISNLELPSPPSLHPERLPTVRAGI